MTVSTTISPAQADIMTAVRSFLIDVLPVGINVIEGQANQVPEPAGTNFVVMSPLRFERQSTNLDTSQDCRFVGLIDGNSLTVSQISNNGVVRIGAPVFGPTVSAGTSILEQVSGPSGGPGVYLVNNPQSVSSQVLSASQWRLLIASTLTVQLDFHSADISGAAIADNGAAAQMAQTVVTTLRDEYGTDFFAALPAPQSSVSPMYADDPQQRPFVNDQQQYEWRWVIDARFSVSQTLSVPQQYADEVEITRISVETFYPA